ncbi:MAG: hypothetical protein L6Q37_05705 [Bdellovibrionaceae bacterium]|nr:hypothetical protein [Pseudobdellovibrionaceae bacterium]NUM57853.1 hypothetical protein [Pseudobdellovibrionaceae bacterium]
MKSIFFAVLTLFFTSSSFAESDVSVKVKKMLSNKDFLGARILLKNTLKKGVSFSQWRQIRNLIYHNPGIGYDIIFTLEKMSVKKNYQDSEEVQVNKLIAEGEQLETDKNFQAAIAAFQKAAQLIRKVYPQKVSVDNQQVYFYILHQIARCFFALKNYSEALKIYEFFPRSYYNLRQTQFEKMWTAFYANKIDIAIGAIASQRSPYFSKILEPDSYIVQIYILRKLCRYKEIDYTLKEIKLINELFKNDLVTVKEWAKMDIDTLSLHNLLVVKENENLNFVSLEQRKSERQKILESLTRRYKSDVERLKKGYTKILSFSILSKKITSKNLLKISDLPDAQVLSKTGYEYWTKKDLEEWLDEIGSQYYIGDSKCQ